MLLITMWAESQARVSAFCRTVWRQRRDLAAGIIYGLGVSAAFLSGFALANGAVVWTVTLFAAAVFVHFAFILQGGRPFPATGGDAA